MQEQINEKTVALSIRATKLTGRVLARAMQKFLQQAQTQRFPHGKQSLRSLAKQGASLSSVEITGDNIGSFKRIARKYNVDFALKRDDSVAPPKWIVFFKAKDVDALTAAFNEFTKSEIVEKAPKPSMLAMLRKFREIAKSIAAPVRNKDRGEREL